MLPSRQRLERSGAGRRRKASNGRRRDTERTVKDSVRGLGSGEVRIQGRGARWRASDTVAPGRDPFSPWDKKHRELLRPEPSRILRRCG